MDSIFDGKWKDKGGLTITITSELHFVELMFSNGRGPFHGIIFQSIKPIICVDFYDDPPSRNLDGLLDKSGNHIYWDNGTVWTRV